MALRSDTRATPPVFRAVEASLVTYKRTWRGSIFSSILSPVLFLAAMGVGLGSLVDENTDSMALEGVSYLTFLAPGLLASNAMQLAANEAAWPVMAGIRWQKTYHAALASPLGVVDVALGTLAWIAVRLLMACAIFAAVMVAFGAFESIPGLVLAVPAGVLTGMAFAAPIAAYSASIENDHGLSSLMRFVIIPLFLFSGTFFPVDQLPAWLEPVAYVTPLWHGVELCRDLSLGTAGLAESAVHVGYLLAWVMVGTAACVSRFRKRLIV
jgi:lipooligosaccharide transport system permease protein